MLTTIATCLLALTGVALSLPTIEGKGSKLFLSTGEQFYIKGIALSRPVARNSANQEVQGWHTNSQVMTRSWTPINASSTRR